MGTACTTDEGFLMVLSTSTDKCNSKYFAAPLPQANIIAYSNMTNQTTVRKYALADVLAVWAAISDSGIFFTEWGQEHGCETLWWEGGGGVCGAARCVIVLFWIINKSLLRTLDWSNTSQLFFNYAVLLLLLFFLIWCRLWIQSRTHCHARLDLHLFE